MLTFGKDHSPLVELDGGSEIRAITFSPDGTYLVSGEKDNIRVWRLEDDEWHIARTLDESRCLSVSVSRDNKWIGAGTAWGWVFVWNTRTFERAAALTVDRYYGHNGVDFSPDATRILSASDNNTASVWDLATRKQIQVLRHDDCVRAAKYSTQGDRIATAGQYNSIRLWDSDEGSLLSDIQVGETPRYNKGLLWFHDHLFIVSTGKIKEFDTSTGSELSEWPVADGSDTSCIALLNDGKIIAHSTDRTVTFWHTSTHTQVGLVQDPQDMLSIGRSSDDRFLAIGGKGGKITIKSLSYDTVSVVCRWVRVSVSESFSCSDHFLPQDLTLSSRPQSTGTVQEPDAQINDAILDPSIPLSRLHPTLQEPEILIDRVAFDSWKNDQLEDAEALLTAEINKARKSNHHILASRALVRARLRHWDTALVDAEMVLVALFSHFLTLTSFTTRPSMSSRPYSATLQRVSRMSGTGKGTRVIRPATLRLSASIHLMLPLSYSSRSVCSKLDPVHPLISHRPSSCPWQESTSMRYRA